MDVEAFAGQMVSLLPQLIRGFGRHEHNYLSQGKISFPQLGVLEVLTRRGAVKMHELAHAIGVTRPAATALVARLIRAGLVARAGDPADRRVVRVLATAKGQRVTSEIWRQKQGMIQRVFGQLSAEDRAQYLATVSRVVEILQREERQG